MQAQQQLSVCPGRHPFSLHLTRSNYPSFQHRTAPTSLHLRITHHRHRFRISATLQGNVTQSIAGAKFVKVKFVLRRRCEFVLRRRCEFGQQFLVVGDDEVVGAWNPEAAVPMQWSEGHIWTTELEVSTGKRIEFKVILVGDEGVLEWQPGPNRVLETMESPSPLVVLETWSGEDQGDAFLGLEMNELPDIQVLSPESVTNAGGVELPIAVMDFEAVHKNIETTVDGVLSDHNVLVTTEQTVSLPPDDSNTDMAGEPSMLEKDLRWGREAWSTLWNKLTKE